MAVLDGMGVSPPQGASANAPCTTSLQGGHTGISLALGRLSQLLAPEFDRIAQKFQVYPSSHLQLLGFNRGKMLLWILLQQGFNQGHGEGTPWCHLPCSITAAARCPLAGETEINLNTWLWEQAQDKGPQLRDHLGWNLKFFNSLKFLILHQLIQSSEERDLHGK